MQHAGHPARQAKCRADANEDSDSREQGALANDEPHDVPTLRSQRHSHAGLVRPLRNGIRNHALNANRGDQQRQRAKHSEQDRVEPPPG